MDDPLSASIHGSRTIRGGVEHGLKAKESWRSGGRQNGCNRHPVAEPDDFKLIREIVAEGGRSIQVATSTVLDFGASLIWAG